MPPTSLDPRKTAAPQSPSTWVPLGRRFYLQRELYVAAMERVHARQYPSLAALIQFAVHEHLTGLAEDERRAADRAPSRTGDRAKRRKDCLDRRADEILAAFKASSEQERTLDRSEIFTSAPIPGADDDLFALSPLLSSDEKAALETIGDWIPDLFAGENQPDEETPDRVSHAKPPADQSAGAGRGGQISHAKPSYVRTHIDDPPVRRRRRK